MHKLVLGVAAALLLSVPAMATTVDGLSFDFGFSKIGKKVSTATHTSISGAPMDSAKGIYLSPTKVVIAFPEGTIFDTSVLPQCKATALQVTQTNGSACSSKTEIASGLAQAIVGGVPENDPLSFDITGYNAKNAILMFIHNEAVPGLNMTIKGTIKGRKLTAILPTLPFDTALTRFDLDTKSYTKTLKVHKRKLKKMYTRTPASCPKSGMWTSKAAFTYATRAPLTVTSQQACR